MPAAPVGGRRRPAPLGESRTQIPGQHWIEAGPCEQFTGIAVGFPFLNRRKPGPRSIEPFGLQGMVAKSMGDAVGQQRTESGSPRSGALACTGSTRITPAGAIGRTSATPLVSIRITSIGPAESARSGRTSRAASSRGADSLRIRSPSGESVIHRPCARALTSRPCLISSSRAARSARLSDRAGLSGGFAGFSGIRRGPAVGAQAARPTRPIRPKAIGRRKGRGIALLISGSVRTGRASTESRPWVGGRARRQAGRNQPWMVSPVEAVRRVCIRKARTPRTDARLAPHQVAAGDHDSQSMPATMPPNPAPSP